MSMAYRGDDVRPFNAMSSTPSPVELWHQGVANDAWKAVTLAGYQPVMRPWVDHQAGGCWFDDCVCQFCRSKIDPMLGKVVAAAAVAVVGAAVTDAVASVAVQRDHASLYASTFAAMIGSELPEWIDGCRCSRCRRYEKQWGEIIDGAVVSGSVASSVLVSDPNNDLRRSDSPDVDNKDVWWRRITVDVSDEDLLSYAISGERETIRSTDRRNDRDFVPYHSHSMLTRVGQFIRGRKSKDKVGASAARHEGITQ